MGTGEDNQGLCSKDIEAGAWNQSTGLPPASSTYPRQLPPNPPQYQQHADAGYTNHTGKAEGAPRPPLPVPAPPQPGVVLPYDMSQVTVIPCPDRPESYAPKSLSVAILLCVVPLFGLFGAHHFYLRRPMIGCLYACSFGMLGLGWLVDCFRICSLVAECNEQLVETQEKGYVLDGVKYGRLTKRSVIDAYIMWFPFFGLCGLHHFYLGRQRYGLFCAVSCTLGVVGWLVDFFRLPYLVRQANRDIEKMRRGETVDERVNYSLLDAYLLAFPLGLFGMHHFYLGNNRRGVLYLCTLGVFGLGWLADMFQMPLLVSEANKDRELRERLANALANQPHQQIPTAVGGTNVIVVQSNAAAITSCHGNQPQQQQQNYAAISEPPPAYVPNA